MKRNTRNHGLLFLLETITLAGSLSTASPRPSATTDSPPSAPILADSHSDFRLYDPKLPPNFAGKLAVSKISVSPSSIFGSPWDFGLSPSIRLSYGLTNLTDHALYVLVNYRTEVKRKGTNTGTGACYLLAPGNHRIIEAISPIAGFLPNLRFILMLVPLDHAPENADFARVSRNKVLVIDPLALKVAPLPAGLSATRSSIVRPLELLRVSLRTSNQVNWITATLTNTTEQARVGGLWVGVNHVNTPAGEPPRIPGGGFFKRESALLPARGFAVLSVAYDLPDSGPHPLLAYQVVECLQGVPDPSALQKRNVPAIMAATDVNPVAWGAADLVAAARTAECVLVPPVPVRERTNLTAETKSPHFVFHYRPGSAAERDIEQIVAARERVYTKLSTLYKMQLPGPVQIDLYPDMEAKALGSGTPGNVANTINASHIAEVYNSMTHVSPGHEIAHIFSFRFPGHLDRGGASGKPGDAFVEGFAGCYEFDNSAEEALAGLRARLNGKPAPGLVELIASPSPAVNDEQVVLVDFLTRKNPESFKTFYVEVIAHPDRKTIDKAARNAYNVSLEELEEEWQQFLRSGSEPKDI